VTLAPTRRSRFRGCLLGGAVGDALGEEAIGADLLGELEGRDVIEQVVDDLYEAFVERRRTPGDRYPARYRLAAARIRAAPRAGRAAGGIRACGSRTGRVATGIRWGPPRGWAATGTDAWWFP
jgi:hypothetical protein